MEIIYLSLHCHHQDDSCIKMGSDESHFNVSVESDGQSHKIVSTNHSLFEEKEEPKRNRAEAEPARFRFGSLSSCTAGKGWGCGWDLIAFSVVRPHNLARRHLICFHALRWKHYNSQEVGMSQTRRLSVDYRT